MPDNYLHLVTIGGKDVSANLYSYEVKDSIGDVFSKAFITLDKRANADLDISVNQDVVIQRGAASSSEYTIFRGIVLSFTKDGGFVTIKCVDNLYRLAKLTSNYTYDKNIDPEAGKISALAKDIVETRGGLTAEVIDSGEDFLLDKFVLKNDFLLERLRVLSDILQWSVYYNPNDDKVHFEPRGYTTFGTVLNVGSQIVDNLLWERDKSRMANKITIIGGFQEVETTETGVIGTDSGYTTTDVLLAEEPVSVKVTVAGDLKTGGAIDASTSFDYYVDLSNKKIVWSSTFSPSDDDAVIIDYSYMVPVKIQGSDSDSVSDHGTFETIETHKDVLTIKDGIERLRERLAVRKQTLVRTQARVYNVLGLRAGNKVRVVDDLNGEDETLLVEEIVYSYPDPIDVVNLGIGTRTQEDLSININERLRRLEREQLRTSDIVVQVKEDTFDLNLYGYTIIEDGNGVTQRVVYWTGEYIEDFRNDDFKDYASANWDNTGGSNNAGILSYD